MDTEPTSSGVATNLNIVHEKVLSVIDPAAYMKAIGKQMPEQFKVTSQENITLFGEPAGKMLIEATLANKAMKEVMYLLKRGNEMYVVTFTAGRSEFDTKLPLFEQSLQTLAIDAAP
jgi:hypothetical protein